MKETAQSDDATTRPRRRMASAANAQGGREFHTGAQDKPVVLIVDDIPDNLLALEEMLQREDIEIVTAVSGPKALEILLARDVALAIVDVQMPEMDGFELASLMRGVEKTFYIPIIFVTAGWRDQSCVFRGYEAGAVDYLFKPIEEHILRSKVDVFVTLENHRRELQDAYRMREMFMAVLGHDLRSPLTGILLSAHILGRRLDPDDPNVVRIRQGGERMARMIQQVLDVTRFRHDGTLALDPVATDVHQLAEQICDEIEDGAKRCRIESIGDTNGTWDADRLLQVLANLIGNATRHCPPEAMVIVHIDGSARNSLRLQVRNEGPPIPEELRGALFEPFRRGNSPATKGEGLGLGLYITRRLVDAHGGKIWFTSDASETSFSVSLPRHA